MKCPRCKSHGLNQINGNEYKCLVCGHYENAHYEKRSPTPEEMTRKVGPESGIQKRNLGKNNIKKTRI